MATARVVSLAALWLGTRVHGIDFDLGLRSWDGNFYIGLAAGGYPRHLFDASGKAVGDAVAFFPVYPLLIRLVHWALPLGWGPAAYLTSFAAAVAAAVLLWRLVETWRGPDVADRMVVLAAFFPGAYVLSLVYAEGVLLAAAAG
jgi:hypothetical protein